MEKIILGMLMMRGLTIYEMKMFIDDNLASMCSNSSGSIHTAIRKMLEKEFIRYKEEDNKKIYFITGKGREAFNNWILQPMDRTRAKNIELSKMFFFGLSDPAKRKGIIKEYIERLKEEHSKLKAIYKKIILDKDNIMDNGIKMAEDDPWNEEGFKKNTFTGSIEDTISDVYKYQLAILQYGMESIEFEIGWYSKYLKNVNF
ncbi:PadR family transcriptional regulator [Clostridium sp. Marseille-P2415]|uniref:PadR family transcriptional regulator n=1 Tax=Clostridium sp. Marseille-P2415 TaxID=1805471 RepID=UPI000A023847|nr:PadR family transcriptional regulator [Clostridium sp. Marseille-P2415]